MGYLFVFLLFVHKLVVCGGFLFVRVFGLVVVEFCFVCVCLFARLPFAFGFYCLRLFRVCLFLFGFVSAALGLLSDATASDFFLWGTCSLAESRVVGFFVSVWAETDSVAASTTRVSPSTPFSSITVSSQNSSVAAAEQFHHSNGTVHTTYFHTGVGKNQSSSAQKRVIAWQEAAYAQGSAAY